jgi:hypothetical protein
MKRDCPACGREVDSPFCPYCNQPTVERVPSAPSGALLQPTGTYEFSEAQNAEFRTAAYWMRIVSIMEIAVGILACFGMLKLRIDMLIQGIIFIIIGVWTRKAAEAFSRVAETTGRDIENIMEAVVNLKKLYRLQGILFLIGVVLVLVAIVVLFGGAIFR